MPDLLVYPLLVLALLFHAMQFNEQLLLAIYASAGISLMLIKYFKEDWIIKLFSNKLACRYLGL
ncbi:MAG: hypothetical protein ACL7BU_14800 [Candidatus Phlomobacter fragariae]